MEARALMEQRKRCTPLEERINRLRDVGVQINGVRYNYNFAQISAATGVSRSAISMFANGHMKIRPEQEAKLEEWVTAIEAQAECEVEADAGEATEDEAPRTFKQSIELYKTREFVEATGLLEWTRAKRKMCVVIGYPGIGKTTVVREFAQRVQGVHLMTCRSTMRMRDLLDTIADSLGIAVGGSNDERVRRIQRELAARENEMLIFDEADHLYNGWDVKKFELLRQLWDETGTPIVLVGPPRLEEILTHGSGRSNLSQLYRRKYEIKLTGIKPDEVREILSQYDVEPHAAAELTLIATDARHGGMGNFIEIFGMCLEAAAGDTVTPEILAGARCYKLQG